MVIEVVTLLSYTVDHIEGSLQDCSNSNALALEFPQSYTEPLM